MKMTSIEKFHHMIQQLKSVALGNKADGDAVFLSSLDVLIARISEQYGLVYCPRAVESELPDLDYVRYQCELLGIGCREVNMGHVGPDELHGNYVVCFDGRDVLELLTIRAGHVYAWSKKGERLVSQSELMNSCRAAIQLYPPLPDASFMGYATFLGRYVKPNLGFLLLTSVSVSALGVVFPIAFGYVLDTLIPLSEHRAFDVLMLGLFTVLISQFLLNWTKLVLLSRKLVTIQNDFQTGIWLRLLQLPLPFFKRFSIASLANRANSVFYIKKVVSVAQLNVILTAFFALSQVIVMMWVDMRLALILIPVFFIFTIGMLIQQLRLMSRYAQIEVYASQASSLVYQFVQGISKLIMSNKLHDAFVEWVKQFRDERKVYAHIESRRSVMITMTSMMPYVAMCCVFFLVSQMAPASFSAGEFMIFFAAFGAWVSAMNAGVISVSQLMSLYPKFKLLMAILTEKPEDDMGTERLNTCTGAIQISNLCFSYDDGTELFSGLDLSIESGEFVAIVGPSGCGKSTLMRLLLGFETPSEGSIFYDGSDFNSLNKAHLRRNFGVVLQQSQLFPGSILDNIVGSLPVSLEDAIRVLEMVGLRDDIDAMPMGLHTLVSDQAGGLSGGQIQRIMIARALIHRPQVLFLDEATSALDNEIQKVVADNINQLKMTRVVVAHRLSTIRHADKIAVLHDGGIAEMGTFQELMNLKGIFYHLAERQV